jgi:hypothetical protein
LEDNPPAKDSASAPYAVLNDDPPPARVQGYGVDPDQVAPAKPPMPLDGYFPPELDRRPDEDWGEAVSLERKVRKLQDEPKGPKLPFIALFARCCT